MAAAALRLEREVTAQQARIDDWDARNAESLAATGRRAGNPPRRPARQYARAREAAAQLGKARQRVAEAGRKAGERGGADPVRNLTDPHSRLMPVRGGGFIQGYNTQNVTSEDGLIIATRLTADPADTAWFGPMLDAALDAAAVIIAARPPAPARERRKDDEGIVLFLADAGYLSEKNLTMDGPDRLIATGKRRDLEKQADGQPGPSRDSPAIAAMAARLATDEGITAYRHRSHIAETPHGHIKHNMGFRQLSVRGRPRATAEWTLACTVHNLLKAISAGHLTSASLAALTAS